MLVYTIFLLFLKEATASCYDEHACVDYTSAVRCNKLEKCRKTAWGVPTVEGDNLCVLCKAEIGVLQDWLKDDAQSVEVRKALEAFCDGIPLTAFRDAVMIKYFNSIYLTAKKCMRCMYNMRCQCLQKTGGGQ